MKYSSVCSLWVTVSKMRKIRLNRIRLSVSTFVWYTLFQVDRVRKPNHCLIVIICVTCKWENSQVSCCCSADDRCKSRTIVTTSISFKIFLRSWWRLKCENHSPYIWRSASQIFDTMSNMPSHVFSSMSIRSVRILCFFFSLSFGCCFSGKIHSCPKSNRIKAALL